MTKTIILTLASINIFASEIPLDFVKKHHFYQTIDVNAKIIQLSNARQSVMSLLDGHIEKYYVKAGDSVKKNDPIALIDSITLSRLTAEYLSLKKQSYSLSKNFQATKKLYDKGLTSLQELNTQRAAHVKLISRIDNLKSQLQTLGIDTTKLKKPTSRYILYSHNDGIVSQILQPLHSVITKETQIINIVKEQSFYMKSYIPIKYADVIKKAKKATLHYSGKDIPTQIRQILPNVDETTQRIVLLSSIRENMDDLFIGAYAGATIHLAPSREHLAIKKTALSFFNNEWVVFVPKNDKLGHNDHAANEKKEIHDHHEHNEDHAEKEAKHSEHEHEDEEIPYEPKVVRVIKTDEQYAAVEGLEENEAYVSDKAYYVKSMLLKSSLGGHGH